MGRPTKLTPEIQTRITNAIAVGNYYEAACGYAGIEARTFNNWMKRGKKASRGIFRDFYEAVKKAEADAEVSIVAQWKQHMPENWQACRDFLARRHPKRWGPQDSLELKGNPNAPLALHFNLKEKAVGDGSDAQAKEEEGADTGDRAASGADEVSSE